jgi:hypothetical protein
MLLLGRSSSPHYRETGGTTWGMLIARKPRKPSDSLLDEQVIEKESSNREKLGFAIKIKVKIVFHSSLWVF